MNLDRDQCDICIHLFKSEESTMEHRKSEHNNADNEDNSEHPSVYVCNYCVIIYVRCVLQ